MLHPQRNRARHRKQNNVGQKWSELRVLLLRQHQSHQRRENVPPSYGTPQPHLPVRYRTSRIPLEMFRYHKICRVIRQEKSTRAERFRHQNVR